MPNRRTTLVVQGLGASFLSIGTLTLSPSAEMQFALGLLLALRAGRWIPRAELRNLLWPDAPEAVSRQGLRQALYRLRKAGLVTDDRGEEIFVDPQHVDCDVERALRADWPRQADPAEIQRAAHVLPGYCPPTDSALGEWLETIRAQIASQHRRAMLHQISEARREGRWRLVEQWAVACLVHDPLNEEATLARAEAAAMMGAKHEALEILEEYRRDLGGHDTVIGLPAQILRRRISQLPETTHRRLTAATASFVGRHDHFAAARDALAVARGGVTTALWLVGPAGIGKSRLLLEIARGARIEGWTVVVADARPSYTERPFALLTALLPALLEASGALGAAPESLALMRQLQRADSADASLSPEEALDRQHAMHYAWTDLMDAVLGESPLVLALDDTQWIDPQTLRMLARYTEDHPAARLAMILAARRLPACDVGGARRLVAASQLRVGPLSEQEVGEYLHAVGLSNDGATDESAQRYTRASGGNPLFLSHLARQPKAGRGRAAPHSDLASLLDSQLRGVTPQATRVLQACSLLGQHATLPRVERVLAVQAPALIAAFGELDELQALPIDSTVPLTPHDLWTDRVRQGMSSSVFRSMAFSVARVLEADAVTDGAIALYWDAAQLYRESGEKQLAYSTLMRCADYLRRSGAPLEASRAYQSASECAVAPSAVCVALTGRIRTLQTLEHWTEVVATIDCVSGLPCSLSPETQVGLRLSRLSARRLLAPGDRSILGELHAIAADPSNASGVRLRAALQGMAAAHEAYDADTISRFYDSTINLAADSASGHATICMIRVVYESCVGDLAAAEEAAAEAVALARVRANQSELQRILRNAAFPARHGGHFELARCWLSEAAEISARHHLGYSRCITLDNLAGLHLDHGLLGDALQYLDEAEVLHAPAGGAARARSLRDTRVFVLGGLRRWSEAKECAITADEVRMQGACRSQMMSLAAALTVATHFGDVEVAHSGLAAIDALKERMFRHTGQDLIAASYATGIATFRDVESAREFATWYVGVRRDRLPLPSAIAELLIN